MENKKTYPPKIGAIWSKQGKNGEYLSIQVEIDGVKRNLTAFRNRFYEEGGKKPMYEIAAPMSQPSELKENNKYNTQPAYQAPKTAFTIKDDEDNMDLPF